MVMNNSVNEVILCELVHAGGINDTLGGVDPLIDANLIRLAGTV